MSNVAFRLCDEAKPGQILISPRVLTKVENTVKVEPVGDFELKGISRPLAAYNVVAAIRSSSFTNEPFWLATALLSSNSMRDRLRGHRIETARLSVPLCPGHSPASRSRTRPAVKREED